MNNVFLPTAARILIFFFYIGIGYLLRKLSLLPENGAKTLSVLETTVFLPATIFTNLYTHVRIDTVVSHAKTLLGGAVFLLVMLGLSLGFSSLLAKRGDRKERNTLLYIFAFSNYAYFGYPLLRGSFGADVLAETVLFAVPFTITIFTLGAYLLTGHKKETKGGLPIPKTMIPVIAAVFGGILLGICGLELPEALTTGISDLSACMSPVSMILTGAVLASYRFPALFTSARAYLIAAVRVVAFPLLVGGTLVLCGVRGTSLIIPTFIASMPVGMNVVIFSEASGSNSNREARICFVSYLLSLISVPLLFMGLQYFA